MYNLGVLKKRPPPSDVTVNLCVGPYSGSGGGGLVFMSEVPLYRCYSYRVVLEEGASFYERGTPVQILPLHPQPYPLNPKP
jgi:hypothetical protein